MLTYCVHTETLWFHYMFVLLINCRDVRCLTLGLGLVSFSLYFNVIVIHNNPPTKDVVNVAFLCVL